MIECLVDKFNLCGRVVIITGGAGLLGVKHAEAVAEMDGIPVLLDIDRTRAAKMASAISDKHKTQVLSLEADVTSPKSVNKAVSRIINKFRRIDILINNAANDAKVKTKASKWQRFEDFSLEAWDKDISVGLTGTFLCSQIVGRQMALQGKGVILNIASDLSIVAPDQRIYARAGLPSDKQPVKPVSYSVVKHGIIGLTRYLAVYWAKSGIRVNALSPGGIYVGQDKVFVKKITNIIPLGRMAERDEYKATVIFLISDASSYMTGANVIMDGGRTVW